VPVGCALKQERAELDAARGAQAAQVQAANSARKQEVVAGREGARKAQVGGCAWCVCKTLRVSAAAVEPEAQLCVWYGGESY
jgi:hypothetical protein